ncbi:hypothetical protein C8R44DRAFT_975074 [Mycena epipterygia]|nr:hypothetical protein C8R44DRAFT_975074 [Mycena epipterygia]
MVDIDQDSFSCILSHIHDSKTLYLVLIALPKSHLLFPVALARLWQLPIYLDSYDRRAAGASQKVLDYLLDDDSDTGGPRPLAESIRHLVVSMEHVGLNRDRTVGSDLRGNGAQGRGQRGRGNRGSGRGNLQEPFSIPRGVLALQERLPELFHRTVNLESLDYHSLPGVDMKSKHTAPLQHLERFRSFAVDCALRNRDGDVPAGGGPYAAPGALSVQYDAEICEIEPLLSSRKNPQNYDPEICACNRHNRAQSGRNPQNRVQLSKINRRGPPYLTILVQQDHLRVVCGVQDR